MEKIISPQEKNGVEIDRTRIEKILGQSSASRILSENGNTHHGLSINQCAPGSDMLKTEVKIVRKQQPSPFRHHHWIKHARSKKKPTSRSKEMFLGSLVGGPRDVWVLKILQLSLYK
jgi:hypothetical protein